MRPTWGPGVALLQPGLGELWALPLLDPSWSSLFPYMRMSLAPNGTLIIVRPPCLPTHHEAKVKLIYSLLTMCHFTQNRIVWCLKYSWMPLWIWQSESGKRHSNALTESADSQPETPPSARFPWPALQLTFTSGRELAHDRKRIWLPHLVSHVSFALPLLLWLDGFI